MGCKRQTNIEIRLDILNPFGIHLPNNSANRVTYGLVGYSGSYTDAPYTDKVFRRIKKILITYKENKTAGWIQRKRLRQRKDSTFVITEKILQKLALEHHVP